MRTIRRGYTWVELVVIICVIVFLLAMLIPAMQQSRTPARRNVCINNMRNLALAVTNYAFANGGYPGVLNPLTKLPADRNDKPAVARVTWLVPMLPYLERTDIYELYRVSSRFAGGSAEDPRGIYLDILACPSAQPVRRGNAALPPCNYVVNTGRADVIASLGKSGEAGYPADWQANGVFFNHYNDDVGNPPDAPLVWISQALISSHDGSSLTLMLSERLDAGSYSYPPFSALEAEAAMAFVWWPSTTNQLPYQPPHASQRINGPHDGSSIHRARPSSNHVTGVNVAFCDGHARFIRQDIDYGVWCLLMTPYGRECNEPGKLDMEPSSARNNYGFLR